MQPIIIDVIRKQDFIRLLLVALEKETDTTKRQEINERIIAGIEESLRLQEGEL